MGRDRRRPWLDYVVALLAVALALLCKLATSRYFGDEPPYMFFHVAVFLSAWSGGVGPGLLATGLSAALVNVLFFAAAEPNFGGGRGAGVWIAQFLFSGAIISVLSGLRLQAKKQLHRRVQQLRTTLESIGDAFYALDREWRFAYVNDHAEEYFGRPKESLYGRTLWEEFPRIQGTEFEQALRRAVAEGVNVRCEGRSPVTGRWVEVDVYPSSEGLSVYFRDVTDRRQAEEELRRAKARLASTVEEQIQALARTTEELRAEGEARRRVEAERRRLVTKLMTISEEERGRISRELHDETGQLLTVLTLRLQALRNRPALSAPLADELAVLQEQTERIARSLHQLAWELRPTSLDDLGLDKALEAAVRRRAEAFGVGVSFDSRLGAERLPAEMETQLYRIVTEAITNALKHAEASKVSVLLRRRSGDVHAIVEDDGRGFDPRAVGAGGNGRLGLLGMRERAALLDGAVHVESSPGRGTSVFVRLPLPDAGASAEVHAPADPTRRARRLQEVNAP
jgi:PAS domain S-box-containing protein